jgi:hypothetical protein
LKQISFWAEINGNYFIEIYGKFMDCNKDILRFIFNVTVSNQTHNAQLFERLFMLITYSLPINWGTFFCCNFKFVNSLKKVFVKWIFRNKTPIWHKRFGTWKSKRCTGFIFDNTVDQTFKLTPFSFFCWSYISYSEYSRSKMPR